MTGADRLHCAVCGRDGAPGDPTWMSDRDPRRGLLHICPDCQRDHLRSIEAKLSTQWW